MMGTVECPYCSRDNIVEDDYYEAETDYEGQCTTCGKYFKFHAFYTLDFWSVKADCLNGGVHDFKKIYTLPEFSTPEFPTTFKCVVCGKIKKGE